MIMRIIYFLLCTFGLFTASAQDGYISYFTGDTTDFMTDDYLPGLLLAGGATDNDDGMQWFLERAGGGDILVMRASGSDGYNDYLYEELGVNVNSVETILFQNINASSDPYVLQQIANAEAIFFAGGDQYNYYLLWKDTPVEDALNAAINEKGITVGGTSAGMAILGDCYYTPSGDSADADEALFDPFHPDLDIIGKGDFLQVPFTENLITDTHYDQRDRAGRHFTFMARIAAEYGVRSYGIAANEYTAVAVDGAGIARAFGEYADYPEDVVYFLRSNCQDDFQPETIQPGIPLTWQRGGAAVKAYQMPATAEAEFTFDLNDWETATGGTWQNWTAENGTFAQIETDISDCADGLPSAVAGTFSPTITAFPNPATDFIALQFAENIPLHVPVTVSGAGGKEVRIVVRERSNRAVTLDTTDLPPGVYFVKTGKQAGRFVKR